MFRGVSMMQILFAMESVHPGRRSDSSSPSPIKEVHTRIRAILTQVPHSDDHLEDGSSDDSPFTEFYTLDSCHSCNLEFIAEESLA